MKLVFKGVLGIKRFTALALIQKSTLVQLSQGANAAVFATPEPTPAVLKAKTDALQASLDRIKAIEQQLATERERLDAHAHELKQALETNLAYVEKTAKAANDPTIILNGGYDVPSEPVKTTVIGVPQNVELAEDAHTTGVLLVRLKAVTAAKAYIVRYCTDLAQADWSVPQNFTSSVNMRLKADAGKRIFVQVKALGPKNMESDWSDIASRIVP